MEKESITIRSGDKSFTLRPGMGKGRIWIECEDGEGGDFNQETLYYRIKKFYDEYF